MRWQVGLVAVAGCSFQLPPPALGDGGDDGGGIDGFTARRPITIANAALTEALVDVPVLVVLDTNNFDYAGAAADGADLRFATGDLARFLPYDIDTFAPTDTSWLWVRVPMIEAPPAPPAQLWLYYGNPAALPAANAPAVWSDYTSIHHMASTADASGNGHGAQQGTTAKLPADTAGAIGRAFAFDGVDDALVVDGVSAYDFTTTATISLWMTAPSFTVDFQCMVCKGDRSWRVHRGNGSQHADFGTTNVGLMNHNLDSGANVSGGSWHHVVSTMDGTFKKIYVDGALDGTQNYAQTLNVNAFPVVIGENEEAPERRNWNGGLDEIRVTALARSASWVGMEHRMVALPADTVAVGAREAVP